MDITLIVHAIAAPFSFSASHYSTFVNFTTPLITAAIFIAFLITMDVIVGAMLINKNFEMFTSLLGT